MTDKFKTSFHNKDNMKFSHHGCGCVSDGVYKLKGGIDWGSEFKSHVSSGHTIMNIIPED